MDSFFRFKYKFYLFVFCMNFMLLSVFGQNKVLTDGGKLHYEIYGNDTLHNESAVKDYIGLYQKYISGSRGTKCLMFPSCSNYGLKAFKDNGFIKGLTLTSDRLLRCGHESGNYQKIYFANEFRLLDYPPNVDIPIELLKSQINSQTYAYANSSNYNDSSLLFVRYLINTEQYNCALLEIERLLFYNRYVDCTELYVNKLICQRGLLQYESALFNFENRFPKGVKAESQVLYQISLIEYELSNFKNSNSCLEKIKNLNDSVFESKQMRLKGILYSREEKWTDAVNMFTTANQYNNDSYVFNKNLELVYAGMAIKKKNPKLAAFLSIIPGLGYAYSGHYQSAVTSLVTNSALAYAVYTSIKTKNYGIAILTSSLNLGFYIGNIIGGKNSAKRQSESKQLKIINSLEEINNIHH